MASSRAVFLKRQSLISMAAFISFLLMIFIIIIHVDNMLVSCLLAFVVSYLLTPAVKFLERLGFSRVMATLFLFVLVGCVAALIVVLTLPMATSQFYKLRTELPTYLEGLQKLIEDFDHSLYLLMGSSHQVDLNSRLLAMIKPWSETFVSDMTDAITQSLTVAVLAPFFAFFMIKDGRNIVKSLLKIVPNSIFEPTLNLIHQINDQMGQFIRARLLESVIVGLVTWFGLFLLSFPYAVLLALFAALTNLVPYVGPIVGAIPAVVLCLLNGAPTLTLALVITVYLVAQLIDAFIIIPLVVAKIVDLHPVTVVVAIIVGSQVMGVLGMLISIPVASVLKLTISTFFKHLTEFRA